MKTLNEISNLVQLYTQGCEQKHPFHIGDVWQHTLLVYGWCLKNDPRLNKVALVHDLGKPNTKKYNLERDCDTFYNHAKESITMCDKLDIELTLLERDLVLEHDNCKAWVNGDKLAMYIDRHGIEFCELLANLVTADGYGQSALSKVNDEIIYKIRNNEF